MRTLLCNPPLAALYVLAAFSSAVGDGASPPTGGRTVVLLGSSTAFGVGASSPAVSWGGLLAAALAPKGFVVRNVSISGTSTADSLARFDTAVAPYNPGFVILATSLANEPAGMPVQTFLNNTAALARRVEALGAIPIVVGPYPYNGFSEQMYAAMHDIYAALEGEGIPVFDFLDAADNGHGHWMPGLSTDGTHPTDAGHRLLFEAIPVAIFESLQNPVAHVKPRGYGSWLQKGGLWSAGTIAIQPSGGLNSWTASFWTKPAVVGPERVLLSVNNDRLQVRSLGDRVELWVNGARTAVGMDVRPAAFDHVALTFQKLGGVARLYVNGSEAGRISLASFEATLFLLGGAPGVPGLNGGGDRFGDVLLYRAPLDAGDVANIYCGQAPWKSIEAWLPLTGSPNRPPGSQGLAGPSPVVAGSWEWSADGVGSGFRMVPAVGPRRQR